MLIHKTTQLFPFEFLIFLFICCSMFVFPLQTFGADADNDGYDESIDCDDTDATVHPNAPEIAGDSIDQNCDGIDCNFGLPGDIDGNCRIDITDLTILAQNWLVDCIQTPSDPACTLLLSIDSDLDGWPGYDDCDDTDPNVYPGATEVCDGVDGDCDGVLDGNEGFDPELCGEENCSGIRFCENDGYSICTSLGNSCGLIECDQYDTICSDYNDIMHTCDANGICLDEDYGFDTCDDVVFDNGTTVCDAHDIYECFPDEETAGADLYTKTAYTYCGVNTGLCNGSTDDVTNPWILFLDCGDTQYCSADTLQCVGSN